MEGIDLRVLVADDESLARERLRHLLADEANIQIIAECANGREAVEVIMREDPDIVFLDIQMPELNGFQVVQALRAKRIPLIIIVTAFREFALPAFDAQVFDFLLKPLDRLRFQETLGRARLEIARTGSSPDSLDTGLGNLLANVPRRRHSNRRLALKSEGRIVFVAINDIIWVSAESNHIEVHLTKSTVRLRRTISSLEKCLPGNQFARVNRSSLVNLERIREIRAKSHGDYFLYLENGATICATRTHRHALVKFLGD